MITSNSRKILSLATSAVMVGASLVFASVPATAAPGDVTIKPTSGVAYNVFNDDEFGVTAVVNGVTVTSNATLGWVISNPDQVPLLIDLSTLDTGDRADFRGVKSTGQAVTLNLGGNNVDLAEDSASTTVAASRSDSGDKSGRVLIDFDDADITTLFITDIDADNELAPTIQPVLADSDTTDDSAVLTNGQTTSLLTAGTGHSGLEIMGLGDGNVSVTVQAWIDVNADATDVDAAFASAVQTVTWYDPSSVAVVSKIERLTATGRSFGNAIGTATDAFSRQDFLMPVQGTTVNALVGSLKFNVAMNFAQIDLSDFYVGMDSTNASTTVMARTQISVLASSGSAALDAAGKVELLTASNGRSADRNGEILIRTYTPAKFAAGDKYNWFFQHRDTDGTTDAPIYKSAQFTITTHNVAATDGGTLTLAPSTDASLSSATVNVRRSTKAVTYTFQLTEASAKVEKANIPVLAKVTAGAFVPTGESFTVSGQTAAVSVADQAVYVTGLSNSSGQFSVTVTAALAAAETEYKVQFFVAEESNTGTWRAGTEYTATYASASASTFTVNTAVTSAAEPTLTFSVADAFGQPISTTSTGSAYSVELKAPNTDNLKAYAVIKDGKASFTFKNWLKTGESDVLTARLYVGTSTTPLASAFTAAGSRSVTVTMYAPTAATAVLLTADKIEGAVVEYNDFITGKKDKIGPTAGTNSQTITGTVVDANGAGIPGAPVTLSAANVQFYTAGTDFTIGSVNLVTDASGAFSAQVWVKEKSATGIKVTATSGTLTDSLLIVSDLPTGSDALKRGNLKFTVNMPATVLVNTTYAVTGKLTDVWGNPVDGATVQFDGFGSAEFNGKASVTKTTDRKGEALVYLRSIKDIDGLASVEISVTAVDHNADGTADTASLATPVSTNVATTSWDETAWSNSFTAQVNFLKSASAAAKVNVGSFNGKLVVYANGYNGKKISWKVGGRWGSAVATSNTARFDRPTPRTGVTLNVEIYVDGKLELTKSVLTR